MSKELSREKDQMGGFSLIELLIVVTIIGVIAAIAVPGLRKARQRAEAGSAIQSTRTIVTAEILYSERHDNQYATFAGLLPEGTLDTSLSGGMKSGYMFTSAVDDPANPKHFFINADPVESSTQYFHYFADDSCILRGENNVVQATATSPPLQ